MIAGLRARAVRLAGGRMRRAVLVLAGGTALAQLIVLAAMPVISRLYNPTEFGAAAGLLALLVVLVPVAALTYDHALPIAPDERAVSSLLRVCALATVVTSIVLGLVLIFAGERIVDLLAGGELTGWLWLLVVGLLVGGLLLTLTGWAIRDREFPAISQSRIAQSVGLVTTQIGAGLLGMGGAGLMLGDVVGRAVALVRLTIRRRFRKTPTPDPVSRRSLAEVSRRYRRFPLVGTWPNLAQGFVLQAPLLLLIGFYGTAVGGVFAFAQRLIAAPVALIVLSVSQVFVAEAADQLRRDPAGLQKLFADSLRRLVRTGVPLLPLLTVVAIPVVPFVFGEAWRDAGLYLVALSPLYAAQILTSPFGGVLDVLERQDLLLVREVFRAIVMVGAVVVADALGYSALVAVFMVGIAGAVSYAVYGAISWYAVRRA